jgi:hypothetical protein
MVASVIVAPVDTDLIVESYSTTNSGHALSVPGDDTVLITYSERRD